jgi:limonene-1,2-epoxide hydrolase
MSQQNIDLVQSFIDAWNRGEHGEMDARLHYHPDVEFLPLRAATEGAYRGIAGMERFVADTVEVFEKIELRWELLDLGERVLAWGEIHLRARGSGIETDIPTGGIFDFRDGKIFRWEDFGSKEKALDAVALPD